MSRHGYIDDYDGDNLAMGRWQGRVASAIRGKRGQALLRDLREALDSMPVKRLIAGDLVNEDGEVCALGCVALKRGIDVSNVDPDEPEQVAAAFDIAEVLAREVAFQNDDFYPSSMEPEQRWRCVSSWVDRNLAKPGEPK